MQKLTGIYKITSPTEKVYIGQSRNVLKRFYGYKKLYSPNQTKLYNSFIKHGVDSHVYKLIYELPSDVSQKTLDDIEILFIKSYKECGFVLLNLKEGGYKGAHSQETKAKIGAINKGRITLGFKGRRHTEESKAKIKAKLLNRIMTDEHKNKISQSNKGKKMSKESIEKTRLANIGKKLSEKHIEAIRQRSLLYRHSEESKNKIRLALTGKPKSEEHKKNLAISKQNKNNTNADS